MKQNIPETLLEAVAYFADERAAWKCVVNQRWPESVTCPRCGSGKVHLIESRMTWRCNGCLRQFSVKVGTIFEDSPIGFAKWLPAMWLIVNCKNGISSCELARDLKVTQKTAWFMLHRIRLAMRNGTIEELADDVEIDETFIGGKARNMHKQVRDRRITGTGGKDKTVVLGVLERGGDVLTCVINERDKATLESVAADAIIPGSRSYSDAWGGYNDFGDMFRHQVIDHAVEYVNGMIHTNGLENFWSLLKRGLKGTYVSVEAFHLFRYLDEQSFRFNQRRTSDADRFALALSQVVGRRVMYSELIGKMCGA